MSVLVHSALLALLLFGCVSLSSTQSCGTSQCSQQYDSSCPQDETCFLYDSCKTTQSSCNQIMGPADSLSVDCYDTCISGHPANPSIPLECCGNSMPVSSTSDLMQTTPGQDYFIARLYSLNELGVYRHNTFCKYNVQCPDNNFDLHYLMVRFDVEAPGTNGECLDFLRYHFTATGATVNDDACGSLGSLPSVLKSGVHGSALTVDFRSNRIERGVDFFLAVTCVRATQSDGAGRKRYTSLSNCAPSMSLARQIIRKPDDDSSDEDYLSAVFPKTRQSYYRKVTVTRKGTVMYYRNTVIVKQDGKVTRFRRIKRLQIYNRIEGHLTFTGSSSPRKRQFPGFGFLRIGNGFAQFFQTLVDPKYLLNEKEQALVRDLYRELYSRQTLDPKDAYSIKQRPNVSNKRVNCTINELAQLNSRSCTDVVRAAANFYLKEDTFQDYCKQYR